MVQMQNPADAVFDDIVAEGTAVVDFQAVWCGPCKTMGAIIEKEIVPEFDDTVKLVKIDIDSRPATAARFGIQAIPAILVFRNGREVARYVGVQDGGRLADTVRKAHDDAL